MNYLKKLFRSLKEIILVMIILYSILIFSFFILGEKNATKGAYILVFIFQLLYITYIYKKEKMITSLKQSYFPFILIGISVAIIFNMIIFKKGIKLEANYGVSSFIYIISSSIIGPIFEEILFRYKLVPKLLSFNKKGLTIVLSGIIFGMCHNNYISGIYGAIIGIMNTFFYLKYKNILIPMVVHISGNLIVNLLFDYNNTILLLGIVILIIGILDLKFSKKLKYDISLGV